MNTMIRKRSWQTVSAESFANGRRTRAAAQATLPLYYTEWNSSSNPRDPRHDEPYSAAFVAKTALEASDLVQGYSFWTFSDIFEENYFPSVPFHGGFGLLNLHGIAKPTYRAFELLHKLGNERLLVDGLHETVNAWVTRDKASRQNLAGESRAAAPCNQQRARASSPCACARALRNLGRAHRRGPRQPEASMAGVGDAGVPRWLGARTAS